MTRLRTWAGQSLYHQLSLATLALALLIAIPVTAFSLVISTRLARGDAQARLEAEAALASTRLGQALQNMQAEVADLARSALVSTALVDAQGWKQYGLPFVSSHELIAGAPTRLALCDVRGRIIGGSAEPPILEPLDWVPAVVERGQAQARLRRRSGRASLLVVEPVRLPGGTVEGALAAEVELEPLTRRAFQGLPAGRLLDGSGAPLAGDLEGWEGRLSVRTALALPEPLAGLGLRLDAGQPRGTGSRVLLRLVAIHLFGALLVLAVALALARRLSERLTRPLRTLAASARAIASSGSPQAQIAVEGHGETAQLAQAFNEMLARLREAQAAVEAALRSETREAESQLRLAYGALEHATEAITILEASGRVAWANEVACRMLGRPRQEVLGRLAFELDSGFTEEQWRASWPKALVKGQDVTTRSVALPDRTQRWLEASLHPLRHGGQDYAVIVTRDVTARRHAEEALRLAGVGTLAAGAAHEINNPLSGIIGNLSYVGTELSRLAQALPPYLAAPLLEIRQAAQEALQGGERVRDVVRGLKTFSRPDDAPPEPTDVVEAMRAAVGLVHHELHHVGHLVERYGEVPRVLATSRRLEQVFLNLLMNAAQALSEHPSTAPAVVVEVRAAGAEVVAEVRDTGPGMAPEVQARIFDPFFTTRPVGSGAGLGLAICHGVISSLGGRIEVESAPGRGSCFRVVLPAMAGGEKPEAGAPQAPAAGQPSPVTVPATVPAATDERIPLPAWARIMAVDDDRFMVAVLARTLAGGPEVVALQDPREALERLLGGERFDLLVCDLMMPDLSGLDIQAALAERRPELAKEMIFITGGAFTARTQAFLASCPNACIEKPFDPAVLRRLVADRLAHLSAERAGAKRDLAPSVSGS